MSSFCSSCSAQIRWVATEATGSHMPLNPNPDSEGNVLLVNGKARVISTEAERDELLDRPQPLYMPHHATCPAADQHRNRS